MELLTIKEASEKLKAKESTVRTWINRGVIPERILVTIGTSRRFVQSRLNEWLESLTTGTNTDECV